MKKRSSILFLSLFPLLSCSTASVSPINADDGWQRDFEVLQKDYYEKIILPSGVLLEDGSRPVLEDVISTHYYGEYRGSHVISLCSHPYIGGKYSTGWFQITTCTIGEYDLTFPGYAALPLVWNKGYFYFLEDAYNRGIILHEDIPAIIENIGDVCFEALKDIDRSASASYKDDERTGDQTMSEEELIDPRNAARYEYYLSQKDFYSKEKRIQFAIKDIYTAYDYGCYDGAYVACITDFFASYYYGLFGTFQQETFRHKDEDISFPDHAPSVWKDGTRYELDEALEQGVLSEDTLPSITAKAQDYLEGKTAIGYPSWWALPED